MIQLKESGQTWWRKPLAIVDGQATTAELAILNAHLQPGEQGVWLNSRSLESGVARLDSTGNGSFKTVRVALPDFVRGALQSVYSSTGLVKGCPDLVLWDSSTATVRLIEVKCPHWDRTSREQTAFMSAAATLGIQTAIAEWEFCGGEALSPARDDLRDAPLMQGRTLLPQSSLPRDLSEVLTSIGQLWAASPLRPRVRQDVKLHWDALMATWIKSELPLAVRKSGGIRGAVVGHQTGRMIVRADNSPAQWAFSRAYEGKTYTIDDVRELLASDQLPFAFATTRMERAQMHYKRTLGIDNINARGWKLCHIQEVGLRNRIPIEQLPIDTIQEHFRLLMSPSNHFLIPLQWSGLGEVPDVIRAIRDFDERES